VNVTFKCFLNILKLVAFLKKMLDEHHTKTFEEKRSMNNVVIGWFVNVTGR